MTTTALWISILTTIPTVLLCAAIGWVFWLVVDDAVRHLIAELGSVRREAAIHSRGLEAALSRVERDLDRIRERLSALTVSTSRVQAELARLAAEPPPVRLAVLLPAALEAADATSGDALADVEAGATPEVDSTPLPPAVPAPEDFAAPLAHEPSPDAPPARDLTHGVTLPE